MTIPSSEFEKFAFEIPISESQLADCHGLAALYTKAWKEAEPESMVFKMYHLLDQLLSIMLRSKNKAEPFGPLMVMGDKRSAIPSDYRGDENENIRILATRSQHPALRARLADIVWTNDRKQVNCGREAVAAYTETVRQVIDGKLMFGSGDSSPWSVLALELLRRAFNIAYQMGKLDEYCSDTKLIVEKILSLAKVGGHRLGFIRTSRLANDFGIGDPSDMVRTIELFAEEQLKNGDFLGASDAFESAVSQYRGLKDNDAVRRCVISSADALEKLSETNMPAMNKAHWLQDAIAKLRLVKDTVDIRERLQAKLLKAQANISDEMSVFTYTVDLSALAKSAQDHVSGQPLVKALFKFGLMASSPSPENLKKQAIELAESSPLASSITASYFDSEGKTIARADGLDFANPTDEGLRRTILQSESYRRKEFAMGAIEAARLKLSGEHCLDTSDLLPILRYSPFVPPNHRVIFAKGISDFIAGDYLSAAHLLFPQLENSLRFILKQSGTDVSVIKSDMTQQDVTLSVLLSTFRNDLEKILGPAIVLEIENIFDAKGGPALRHGLAHGLLEDNMAWDDDVIHGCWFILHLCLLPLRKHVDELSKGFEGRFIKAVPEDLDV